MMLGNYLSIAHDQCSVDSLQPLSKVPKPLIWLDFKGYEAYNFPEWFPTKRLNRSI